LSENLFLKNIESTKPSSKERAIALLWYYTYNDEETECSISDLIKVIEHNGFGKQNAYRLKSLFLKDKRIIRGASNKFKIAYKTIELLNEKYIQFLINRPIKKSNAVIDVELFSNSHGYIKKVVLQLNLSYDYSLFDCCSIMCRRLLETLIIEVFEEYHIESSIKDNNGNYFMFSDLLNCLVQQNNFQVSRNTQKYLKEFKTLGDLSAHNRRFNARKSDIDKIKFGLRVASEELLHLAKQGP
jgi:hypothetical protein